MNQLCIIFVDGICLLVFGKLFNFIECAILETWVMFVSFYVLGDRKAIGVTDIPLCMRIQHKLKKKRLVTSVIVAFLHMYSIPL